MAKNYIQPGKTITLAAPYARESGEGALIGSIFAVALVKLANAASGEWGTEGVWDLAKTSAQAWTVGDKIYWDNTNKRCDNVPTAGFRQIGVCVEAAANPTSTGKVRLDGVTATFEDDAAPAAASIATAGAETYTAAQILGGVIVRDPAGASRTDTLPTAALLVAAVPGARVGDIIRCLIVNGADAIETITLAAGAGGAFDANQTAASRVIGQNASKLVHIRLTNVTAASEAYVVYA